MSSKKPSGRNPNALEKKIHKAALQAKRPLTQKEIEAIAPDASKRTDALNFLTTSGLMTAQQASGGALQWRAVTQEEFNIKQSLNTEEDMVLTQIQNAGNQGIWTKHLKTKTELHQTVIDRCLKSLASKQLIKTVKNVKYPTRKIYMLSSIDPSVELTGGPWYTDNEFDSEFIKNLCAACLRYIRDCTFPRQKADVRASAQPLYAPSSSPDYPSAQQIQAWITRSKITPTKLSQEHVEELLNVLVLDGEIEKLPAYGTAMFAASNNLNDSDSDSGSEDEDDSAARKSKKRKRSASSSSTSRKRRRTANASDSDSGSDDGSDSDDDGKRKSKDKKKKKSDKKRRRDDGSDSDDDSRRKRKKKRRSHDSDDDALGSSDDDDDARRKRKRSKSKSSRHASPSASSTTASDGDSGSGSDSSSTRRSAKKKRARSKSSSSSKRKDAKNVKERSSSPAYDPFGTESGSGGGAHVYRAVRQERVALGWAQAPCGPCPQFDFCSRDGPVAPASCEYYRDWLTKAVAALE